MEKLRYLYYNCDNIWKFGKNVTKSIYILIPFSQF